MKKKKKGFTLVELLVVIAILAILASVSVVGYLGFTNKANKSVDEQLCTQYNTLLAGESVFDDDVSLAEFILLLEENNLNHNYFKTSSKDYKFAFDSIGNKMVLVDPNNGNVLFPTNYNSNYQLEDILPNDFKLIPYIDHYTLISTLVYNDNIKENKEIYLDLNNYALKVEKISNDLKLNVSHGTVLDSTGKVVAIENVNKIDASNGDKGDWGIISNNEADYFSSILSEQEKLSEYKVFENKIFSGLGSALEIDSYSFGSNTKKVTFKNCTFIGLKIWWQNSNGVDFEFDECKFYNSNHYTMIFLDKDSNVVLKNSVFENCNRGINVRIYNDRNVDIINNTFKLVSKGNQKNNAIVLSADYFEEQNITETTKFTKLNIEANKFISTNSILQLHNTLVCDDQRLGNANNNGIIPETYDIKLVDFFTNNFRFKQNIKENETKVSISDPDVSEIKNKLPEGDYEIIIKYLDNYNRILLEQYN